MFITTYADQAFGVLEECVKKYKKIIICPFGERGRQVKRILNAEFGINEICIADNNYIGKLPVIKCNDIPDNLPEDTMILLCCENPEAKRQIRDSLSRLSAIPVVDVFPENKLYIFNWGQVNQEDEQRNQLNLLYGKLHRLVFDGDDSAYSVLKNYRKEDLPRDFEIFLAENVMNKSLQRAYSLLLYAMLKELHIEKEEPLAGKASYRAVNRTYPLGVKEELYQLEKDKRIIESESNLIKDAWDMRLFTRFPGGHVVPGYERLLKRGIGEYLSELRERYITAEKGGNKDKCLFYEAEIAAVRSLQELLIRYARTAEEHMVDSKICRQIKKNCEYISSERPKCLEQALQLLWIMHELMIAEGNIKGISMGRMDQYLYPFYEQDISMGLLSETEAYELILCFWKKFAFDRKALAFQNVTIGGKDNPLTALFLKAQLETRANQPMLSLRINQSTSDVIWNKAIDTISTGMGVPALFNDDCIIRAKQYAGISMDDATNYSIVGCVEQTIGGKEYSHTEGLRLNLAKLLELMMFQGFCPVTGKRYLLSRSCELQNFSSFDEFYDWYKAELYFLIDRSCRLLNQADISYGRNWPAPYLSLFMEGCIETGRDVTDGGAVYNNLSINFAGMANVVNAFFAVKKIVYDEKKISLMQIPEILRNDFKGYEDLREEIDRLPKYGNNNREIDKYAESLAEHIILAMERRTTHRNGRFQAGFYTVTLHAEMGKYMLAAFDGREMGTALASSLSPVQGTDLRGPLAVFHSITKMPMSKMSNGMVLDLKFAPEFFRGGAKKEKIKTAVRAYFDMGGMEIQFNVVERETLLQAQEHPEKYENLLVRVSGFSTYFVELDKVLQDEIIARYMHRI